MILSISGGPLELQVVHHLPPLFLSQPAHHKLQPNSMFVAPLQWSHTCSKCIQGQGSGFVFLLECLKQGAVLSFLKNFSTKDKICIGFDLVFLCLSTYLRVSSCVHFACSSGLSFFFFSAADWFSLARYTGTLP